MNADPHGSRWEALRAFALRLTEEQTAELPLDALGAMASDLRQLIEAGVLIERSGWVRFSHDTLLDHVAARAFVEDERSLIDEVLERPQELSRRPFIRRILNFERDADRERYRASARSLIEDERVRFHLRDVVFDVLRQDLHPEPADWALISAMVRDPSHVNHQAAWTVAIQPAYLRVIDRTGVLLRWMTSEEESDWDRAASLLRHLERSNPSRAATVMAPFLELGEHWHERIRWVLSSASPEGNRGVMNLLLLALGEGVFDLPAAHDAFWYAAHDLPEKRPQWGVELLTEYLRRALSRTDGANPFEEAIDNDSHSIEDFVRRLSRRSAGPFARAVLPFVIEVVEAAADLDDGFRQGDPWAMRYTTPGHGVDDALIESLDAALRELAAKRPASFEKLGSTLVPRTGFLSLRFLLYRAWTENPGEYWQTALQHLLSEEDAFLCGYLDSPYWVTRDLLGSIQSVASKAVLQPLETRLLQFFPDGERRPDARTYRGSAQLVLLDAFDDRKLSDEALRRRDELRRKLGPSEDGAPRGIQVGIVGSPIPEDKAQKMTDRSWLRAIARYDSDERSGRDFSKGGAVQLSRILEQQTKSEPERFAKLALRFPTDVNPSYVDALLRSLGDSEIQVAEELLFELLRHFFDMPGRPGGRWLTRVVAQFANKDVPPDILDIVAWHATESPDPERDLWRKDSDEDIEYYGGDPFSAGINTVRGAAAEAVSVLIWPSAGRLRHFLPTLERLARDRVLAVRVCAAVAVRTAYNHDRDRAVGLFLELCNTDDVLLGTRPAEDFISAAVHTHLPLLRPVLERMLRSDDATVQNAAGRQIALAALGNESASDLAESAIRGTVATRVGIAQVAASNVLNEQVGERCVEWLSTFFDDEDTSVRDEASTWLRQLGSTGVRTLKPLVHAYIASAAYQDNESDLLHALDDATVNIVDVALPALQRFIDNRGEEMGDFQRRAAFAAMLASKIAVRAYTSADTDERREQALDIVDALLAAKVSGIQPFVESFD